jgi:hypothetical protein
MYININYLEGIQTTCLPFQWTNPTANADTAWAVRTRVYNKLTRVTPWGGVSEDVTVAEHIKKFSRFYKMTFLTAFIKARQRMEISTRLIQPTPSHSIPLKSRLILSPHLHLDIPNCPLSTGFPPENYVSTSHFVPRLPQNSWLDHPNNRCL